MRGGVFNNISIISPGDSEIHKYINKTVLIALQSHEANLAVAGYLHEQGFCHVVSYYMNDEEIGSICQADARISRKCILCAFVESCPLFMRNNIHLLGVKVTVIEQINFMLTTNCTLNCIGCAAHVNEMKKQISIEMKCDNLIKYVEAFTRNGYYIHQVMLSGGEPLLNKDICSIVSYLEENEYVGYVKILSNGVVRITEEFIEMIKKCRKTVYWIDDYGNHLLPTQKKIINKNMAKLEEYKCEYIKASNENGMWFDFGQYELVSKKKAQNNNSCCFTRHCYVVLPNGYFTICSHFGVGIILNKIEAAGQYLDLNKKHKKGELELILKLQNLIGCSYCNGTDEKLLIDAGVQYR